MKRKPHFRHIWHLGNQMVVRINLRTTEARWIGHYSRSPSALGKKFWDETVARGESIQITRKQARAFAKSGIFPLVEA